MPENSSWPESMKDWDPMSFQETWRTYGQKISHPYEDETQNKQSFFQLAEELEPMPEVGDYYTGIEILLPRGDEMARGHVVARSKDANGNVMGRSHTNPILDTRMYQVEFAGGKVIE